MYVVHAMSRHSQVVKTLLRRGADVEIRNVRGEAPLHYLPCPGEWLHWAAYDARTAVVQVRMHYVHNCK